MLIRPAAHTARRRSAFTLLEVLVVVAILVVLAGVSSIFVFKYLEDAKKDRATLDMKTLESVYESFTAKNGGTAPQSVSELVPYIKQGSSALTDPWGGQYQFRAINTEVGERVQFFTVAPDGQEIAWPKQ
ncbi:MAG: prepilin-type N-terminal cleavage/methylation domain-containing protein [Fimbriiglobus sp.]